MFRVMIWRDDHRNVYDTENAPDQREAVPVRVRATTIGFLTVTQISDLRLRDGERICDRGREIERF